MSPIYESYTVILHIGIPQRYHIVEHNLMTNKYLTEFLLQEYGSKKSDNYMIDNQLYSTLY